MVMMKRFQSLLMVLMMASLTIAFGDEEIFYQVELSEVKEIEKEERIYAVGTLMPQFRVVIRPEVSGKVAEIAFKEGAEVAEGALLIQLEDRIERANRKDAEAKYQLAKLNVDRLTAARGGATLQTLDSAKAALLQSEADLEIAHSNLDKRLITAPFSGVLGLKSVELGDYIQAGTALVTLTNREKLQLEFNLPERVAHVIRVGQKVRFKIDNFPKDEFSAEVYAISPEIEQEGRSLAIRALYDNQNDRLIPGMFARLVLDIPLGYSVIEIPEEAMFALEGKHYLYVAEPIEGREEYYRLSLREIKIGDRTEYSIEVLEGLEGGEIVVKSGQQRVRDGAEVTGFFPPNLAEAVESREVSDEAL